MFNLPCRAHLFSLPFLIPAPLKHAKVNVKHAAGIWHPCPWISMSLIDIDVELMWTPLCGIPEARVHCPAQPPTLGFGSDKFIRMSHV